MVERLYFHNQLQHNAGKLKMKHSPILGCRLPVLEYDPLLDFFIDFQWNEFIAKKVFAFQETKIRAEKAEEKIRRLHTLLCESNPANWDAGFAECVNRETSGRDPSDQEKCIAAIKYIASMTDSYVDLSIRRHEGSDTEDGALMALNHWLRSD